MLRFSLAAGAMALCFAVPAFAQNTMSSPPAGTAPMSSGGMSGITCDQMMTREQAMSTSATGARLSLAQNETILARRAEAQKDDAGCKMHMEKAMKVLR
jgi:hypothetical protein